jgi:hypothetical protein
MTIFFIQQNSLSMENGSCHQRPTYAIVCISTRHIVIFVME